MRILLHGPIDEVTGGQWFDLESGEWLEDGLSLTEIMRLELVRLRRENATLRSAAAAD